MARILTCIFAYDQGRNNMHHQIDQDEIIKQFGANSLW